MSFSGASSSVALVGSPTASPETRQGKSPASSVVHAVGRQERKAMFCGKCGQELEVGARFCGKCGQAIPTDNESVGAPTPVERTPEHPKVAIVLLVLSFFFYIAAVVDYVSAMLFDCDLTGVRWSPLLLGGIGTGCSFLAKKLNPNLEEDSED